MTTPRYETTIGFALLLTLQFSFFGEPEQPVAYIRMPGQQDAKQESETPKEF